MLPLGIVLKEAHGFSKVAVKLSLLFSLDKEMD